MPKVTSKVNGVAGQHGNILKRNQACHQCRRRKLKCDAKRPCSTCIRSHAHAVSHAPAGTQLPPEPECTFDDLPETTSSSTEGPKTRYEKLEGRINELEALLRQKDDPAHNSKNSAETSSNSPTLTSSSGPLNHSPFHQSQSPHNSSPSRGLSETGFVKPPISTSDGLLLATGDDVYNSDMTWTQWPPNLPGRELLRHLVEVFFTFHPHANRLFHSTSFMTSLALPPKHPKFPIAPVLHGICALGSLYTAAVSSPPLPDFSKMEPDEIFSERHRMWENRPDSFAEQQAKFCRDSVDAFTHLGHDLFQTLQAAIILSWYYFTHARWVELFSYTAHSLRLSIPLGLNMCPPFHSISKSLKPISLLPPARTVIEDETRRNAFWLSYAMERQHGASNGWALSLDDDDVSQLLPVRGDQFEQGTLVTPHDRQWAHTKNLLLVQPESQCDSFILYIKSTILLSHVKTFNTRFRAKHYSGDEYVTPSYSVHTAYPDPVDPRGSPSFAELDHCVASFIPSFPSHLRNPIANNVVDNHLYTAYLSAHASKIILHDPHADVRKSGCVSALKILTSARAILDLVYNVASTSFDVSLLDPFCAFCWFLSGRVLTRFLQAAIESNNQEHVSSLRGELNFLQTSLANFGQRLPVAYRLTRMLDNLISQTNCYPSEVTSTAISSELQLRYDEQDPSMKLGKV